jgi:hypothetical protein
MDCTSSPRGEKRVTRQRVTVILVSGHQCSYLRGKSLDDLVSQTISAISAFDKPYPVTSQIVSQARGRYFGSACDGLQLVGTEVIASLKVGSVVSHHPSLSHFSRTIYLSSPFIPSRRSRLRNRRTLMV